MVVLFLAVIACIWCVSLCRYEPPDFETMRVPRWHVSDTDGKEHLVAQGNESRPGAFQYDTFAPFRDYLPFPKHACMSDVEIWICASFGFKQCDLPATEAEDEKF